MVAAVIAASLFGAYAALDTYDEESQLSVGQIELSADPGEHGALDLYVPLVDWGVRFEDTIRLPIRLNVDLRTVDRSGGLPCRPGRLIRPPESPQRGA